MLRAIVATLSAALLLGASSQAHALTKLQQRGQALAQRLCSTCHAVGVSGDSPHIGAPRFRELGDRLDLATFARTLRRGLESGHQDMPRFKFTREDADAMTAYLRAIQK
jgi:mono/diheme cytochrome c family protein